MNLESIVLSETKETQKIKYHMVSFISGILKKKKVHVPSNKEKNGGYQMFQWGKKKGYYQRIQILVIRLISLEI